MLCQDQCNIKAIKRKARFFLILSETRIMQGTPSYSLRVPDFLKNFKKNSTLFSARLLHFIFSLTEVI